MKHEPPPLPKPDLNAEYGYYGLPILKRPAWNWSIPAYVFAGGLSAGSTLLAVGAEASGRTVLCGRSRLAALVSLGAGLGFLVSDLGRPDRFLNMLRVFKPSSPMSVGTWILVFYSPGVGLAAAAEMLPGRVRRSPLGRLIRRLAPSAARSSAALAPAVASYTAVLLSQTAVPAWNAAYHYLPFVFTGSAAASSGGLGMILAPVAEAGPARRFAATGAVVELVASRMLEPKLGMIAEAYHAGSAGRMRRASEYLTAAGLVGTLASRRSRTVSVASGLALMAGSLLQRLGVFEAGVNSTVDPRYVVIPQAERLESQRREPQDEVAGAVPSRSDRRTSS